MLRAYYSLRVIARVERMGLVEECGDEVDVLDFLMYKENALTELGTLL
jgi:hypothetical protein